MKDTCTQENAKDFRQRYANTVGALIKESSEKQWVWIREVTDSKVIFTDLSGKGYEAINGEGVEFEFTQVPMGWYNTEKGPLLFMRRPARQWQRGIATANTTVLDDELKRMTVDLHKVAAVMTFKGERKDWPWALSKFFCVSRNKELWFLDEHIGTFRDNAFVVGETCPVVQELQDTVRRLNLPYTVVMEKT